MPKVSVIIPSYNHARYLGRRLDSVLGQTFADFEVLFLDDRSPDDSRAVFEAHPASSDPRVRAVFNDRNSGSTFKQWNRGLGMARGEYVWIAESDDWAEPDLLAELVARLDAHPGVGLAYCDSARVGPDGSVLDPSYASTITDVDPSYWSADFVRPGASVCRETMVASNTVPNASAVLLRKAVLDRIGPAPETFRVCGDWIFWARAMAASDVAYVARSLNNFRTHGGTVRAASQVDGLALEESIRVQLEIHRSIGLPADLRARMAGILAHILLDLRREPGCRIPASRQLRVARMIASLHRKAARILIVGLARRAAGRLGLLGAARSAKRLLAGPRRAAAKGGATPP